MRRCSLSFLLFLVRGILFFIPSSLGALPEAPKLAERLGWTFEDTLTVLGSPAEIFPHRGENPDEDNVVFYYDEHLYLFWFQDRVWQVRIDERWEGETGGIAPGMLREEILGHWGEPLDTGLGEWTYVLPDQGYPVRARLYFNEEDRLVDLYVYRSDW